MRRSDDGARGSPHRKQLQSTPLFGSISRGVSAGESDGWKASMGSDHHLENACGLSNGEAKGAFLEAALYASQAWGLERRCLYEYLGK